MVTWEPITVMGTSRFLHPPNPARDLLHIQIDHPDAYVVRIADISGRTVFRTSLDRSSSIDISNLAKGIYLVMAGNGKITLSKSLVIQ